MKDYDGSSKQNMEKGKIIRMYNVKGKWALITGAARGIGRLAAIFMAEQGCNMILHSRELSHTEKTPFSVR